MLTRRPLQLCNAGTSAWPRGSARAGPCALSHLTLDAPMSVVDKRGAGNYPWERHRLNKCGKCTYDFRDMNKLARATAATQAARAPQGTCMLPNEAGEELHDAWVVQHGTAATTARRSTGGTICRTASLGTRTWCHDRTRPPSA
eukprot:363419-Chlamydomonas_euryale.AAC.6